MSVTMAASRPPVTASGMFQRCNGVMRRLRPTPTKNTTIAIVNVRSPGACTAVMETPFSRDRAPGTDGGERRQRISRFRLRGKQAQAEAFRKEARCKPPLDAVAGVVQARSEGAEPALAR